MLHIHISSKLIKLNHFPNNNMQKKDNLATILDFGSHFGFIFRTVMSQNKYFFKVVIILSYLIAFNYLSYQMKQICDILAFWILAAILKIKYNNFQRNRFLGLENIHLDLFYCFLRHLQANIQDFGGHLGKMANRKNAQHLESGSKRIQQLKT